jgi:hypothetical protein
VRVIAWYRIDRWPAARRTLTLACAFIGSGACVIGLSFLTHQPERVRVVATVLGLVLTLAGPVTAILGLRRPLNEDLYIAVLLEGLLLHLEGEPKTIPWDDLLRVTARPATPGLVLELRDGSRIALDGVFAGVTSAELAARLDDARRKAAFSLLR